MKKTTRNKQWLRNKDQRKNPKTFLAEFTQNRDGSFTLFDGTTRVLQRKNQYTTEWVDVNARDLAEEMKSCGIKGCTSI